MRSNCKTFVIRQHLTRETLEDMSIHINIYTRPNEHDM